MYSWGLVSELLSRAQELFARLQTWKISEHQPKSALYIWWHYENNDSPNFLENFVHPFRFKFMCLGCRRTDGGWSFIVELYMDLKSGSKLWYCSSKEQWCSYQTWRPFVMNAIEWACHLCWLPLFRFAVPKQSQRAVKLMNQALPLQLLFLETLMDALILPKLCIAVHKPLSMRSNRHSFQEGGSKLNSCDLVSAVVLQNLNHRRWKSVVMTLHSTDFMEATMSSGGHQFKQQWWFIGFMVNPRWPHLDENVMLAFLCNLNHK